MGHYLAREMGSRDTVLMGSRKREIKPTWMLKAMTQVTGTNTNGLERGEGLLNGVSKRGCESSAQMTWKDTDTIPPSCFHYSGFLCHCHKFT